jgi:hypothetical protein
MAPTRGFPSWSGAEVSTREAGDTTAVEPGAYTIRRCDHELARRIRLTEESRYALLGSGHENDLARSCGKIGKHPNDFEYLSHSSGGIRELPVPSGAIASTAYEYVDIAAAVAPSSD